MRLRLLRRLEVVLVGLLDHGQGDAHVLRQVRAAAVVLHNLQLARSRLENRSHTILADCAPYATPSVVPRMLHRQISMAPGHGSVRRCRHGLLGTRLAVPDDLIGGCLVEAEPVPTASTTKDRRKREEEERATDVAQVGARHLNGGLLFHISPVT